MSEDANEAVPNDSDPLPDELEGKTPEEILKFAVNSIPQRKGLQRAMDKLRLEQKSGIRTEDLQKNIDLTNETLNSLIDVFGDSPLNDEETAAKFKSIKDKTAQVRAELSTETEIREEIADTLGKYGLDYDDDTPQGEVLRAHYDAGDFDSVRTTLKKIEAEHATTDIETRANAMFEERLREEGKTVVPSGSNSGSPPAGQEKILLDLEKGDLTPDQALAAAVALAPE